MKLFNDMKDIILKIFYETSMKKYSIYSNIKKYYLLIVHEPIHQVLKQPLSFMIGNISELVH